MTERQRTKRGRAAPDEPCGRPSATLLRRRGCGTARTACSALALIAGLGSGACSRVEGPPTDDPAAHGAAQQTEGPLPQLATPRSQSQAADSLQRIDPTRDGWDSEALAAAAKETLDHIAHRLEDPEPMSESEWAEDVEPSFMGTDLVPSTLELAFEDRTFRVQRASAPSLAQAPATRRGLADWTSALEDLRAAFVGADDPHVKIKVVRIEERAQELVTLVAYQDQARDSSGAKQRSATWRLHWTRSPGRLKLSGLRLEAYEEVLARTAGSTLFSDCTESVLGDEPAYRDQLRHGSGYWAGRLEGLHSRTLLEAHMGVSVADVNGDELEDLYVCQPGGLPNRLFLQNLDGTLRDASAAAGVDVLDESFSSLLVDLDGDGDPDLALLTGRRLFLFANDGQGQFTERARQGGGFGYSLSAADYDEDGDLDLFRCSYRPSMGRDTVQFAQPVPLHNATNGGSNVLLRNDGDFVFSDVTASTGMDQNNDRWSYAAAWEDYDNDGDQDLYVANDYGHNNLYRNDGGRFVDVAAEAGALDANFGMSVTWGDVDHDGWMDLYVSNMFSAAGNRVVTQPGFKPGMSEEGKAAFLRLARGNTLLVNRPAQDGSVERRFADVSDDANTTMGRWSWSSLLTDINNDGWDDLLVANGYLTQETDADL